MGTIYKQIKAKISTLPAKTKRLLIFLLAAAVMVLLGLFLYDNDKTKQDTVNIKKENLQDIQLDRNLIEKTALQEQRNKNTSLEKRLNKALSKLDKLEQDIKQDPYSNPFNNNIAIPNADELIKQTENYPPPPDNIEQQDSNLNYPQEPMPEPKIIGGISIITNPDVNLKTDEKKTVKQGESYFLPPSFMKAGLLTGFNALTSGRGQGNTEPVLIRIQAPAVLPNDVKAKLQGCFIVAEAFGDLAKERADIRLITLSCISKEGKSVIDSKIKGFVTDEDGKVGLSGRVVSKMGASIARSFIAGIFKGVGDNLEQSTLTTSVNSLTGVTTGVTNNDTDSLLKGATGSGLSSGADSLSKFYLELAKQTGPVIEVKSGKKITAVISEGVQLEIKEL